MLFRSRLDSVTVPGQVFSGERFPIDVAVEAPGAAHVRVELTAEGKTIGASEVELAAGVNRLRLEASVNTVGAIALAGNVAATGLGEARFEDTVTLRSPRVLLVSRDPAASEEHLIRALHANQFEVEQAPGGVPPKLDDFQLVVINNWDMESIPPSAKASLEDYVKKGGGLVWISGEHNIYVDRSKERRGGKETGVRRVLFRSQQLGHGIDSPFRQGIARRLREEGRGTGLDLWRAQYLRGQIERASWRERDWSSTCALPISTTGTWNRFPLPPRHRSKTT